MFNIQDKVNGIVKSYEGYIPAQFIDKPKAKATIDFIIRVALADAILDQLAIAFSMNEATGDVLTLIAENFGLSRNLPASAKINFFQEPDYAETAPKYPGYTDYIGFTSYYNDNNVDSVFRRYSSTDSLTTNVPDDILKKVIIFKVLSEKCRGTLESIISLLQASGLSNQVVIADGGDRTIVYRVNTSNSLLADILYNLNYFPRPIGIESQLVKVNNPYGVFHLLHYGGGSLGFCFNAYGEPLNNRSWLQYSEINNFNP